MLRIIKHALNVPWILVILSLLANSAYAGVVINGTRIIYPADSKSEVIQITNEDKFPNVVQVWMDKGNINLTADNADAPFIVTPPIFRMEPGAGHSVRIMYSGEGLPQDRESIFYFNMLQISPISAGDRGKNQLNILVRQRLKVFYRPKGIKELVTELPNKQRFTLEQSGKQWLVTLYNESGYYANYVTANIQLPGRKPVPLEFSTIEPYSTNTLKIPAPSALPQGKTTVDFVLVNDFGGITEGTYTLVK